MTGGTGILGELRPGFCAYRLAADFGPRLQKLQCRLGRYELADHPTPRFQVRKSTPFRGSAPVLFVDAEIGTVFEGQPWVPRGDQVVIDVPVRGADVAIDADPRADGQVLGVAKAKSIFIRPLLPAPQVVLRQP